MAMKAADTGPIRRLARFGLTTGDTAALAAFYEQAFGFRHLKTARLSGAAFERLMAVEHGAESVWLGLGDEIVELTRFDAPGRAYPEAIMASDLMFQHFAIVVADMDQAYRRLRAISGWTPISWNGPQRLPASSGGVSAFKFRDPEGHPLELLAYPAGGVPERWKTGSGLCLGIDHSAISVRDAERSIAFYETLGLRLGARSFNHGSEQSALDGLEQAELDVVALEPIRDTPHLELLCYHSVAHRAGIPLRSNDIAATRLVFETGGPPSEAADPAEIGMVDPDGHHLLLAGPTG
jgi:catechol 2,3-dioxygenase-like lactoylglutathione lyase family enzyme